MSAIHDKQAEEPIGRWENRCPAIRCNGFSATWADVCDRPSGHAGLHRGRRLSFATKTVTAYIGWTS